MKEMPHELVDIISTNIDMGELSSRIITYMSNDDSFDEVLSDSSTIEYRVYNLAIQYLDTELEKDKTAIREELEAALDAYLKQMR